MRRSRAPAMHPPGCVRGSCEGLLPPTPLGPAVVVLGLPPLFSVRTKGNPHGAAPSPKVWALLEGLYRNPSLSQRSHGVPVLHCRGGTWLRCNLSPKLVACFVGFKQSLSLGCNVSCSVLCSQKVVGRRMNKLT